MKQTRTIVLLLLCVVVSMSGCGGKKDTTDVKPVNKGGKISIGSTVEPDTWNPLVSDLVAVQEVGRLIFSGLLTLNDQGEWIPDLAQDVPRVSNGGLSADGLVVTYKLRPNLKWHDGTPLTAKDVRFTYDFVMKNRARVPWGEAYEKIISLETPDDLTLVVKFRERVPHYGLLFQTVLPNHQAAILADLTLQNFNSRPVGSGPFKLINWRRGDSLEFAANPDYHRGRPNLDTIVYQFVPDRQTVLSQLKIGEVDMVNNIGQDQVDALRTFTGVNAFIAPGLILEQLVFNVDVPALNDPRTRQAITRSIDRTVIVEKVLRGAGFPAISDVPPMSWAADKAKKVPERNLAGARELLTQAGWRPGADGIQIRNNVRLSFALLFPAKDPVREAVAKELAAQLREAGVEVRLQPLERKQLFETLLPNRKFEAVLFASVTTIDPDGIDRWHSQRIPFPTNRFTGKNYAGWRNMEADMLLDQLAWTATREKQREIYLNFWELVSADAPMLPLYYRPEVAAAKRSIANFKQNPVLTNFWNAWEWALRRQ